LPDQTPKSLHFPLTDGLQARKIFVSNISQALCDGSKLTETIKTNRNISHKTISNMTGTDKKRHFRDILQCLNAGIAS